VHASNSVRAICFGGTNPSPTPGNVYNTIYYHCTLGNAQDFGDLQNHRFDYHHLHHQLVGCLDLEDNTLLYCDN
jgi:hypothetical protein